MHRFLLYESQRRLRVKKEESKFRLVGQTLDEESILNAVDTEMFASGESRRLGFRLTSSGKPPSNFSGLADKELMKDMMDYTSMMMKKQPNSL